MLAKITQHRLHVTDTVITTHYNSYSTMRKESPLSLSVCVFALIEPRLSVCLRVSKAHPGFYTEDCLWLNIPPLALIDSWLPQISHRGKRIWDVCVRSYHSRLLPLPQTLSISGEEVRNLFCIADDGSFDLLSETQRKSWNAAWNNSVSFLVYSLLNSLFVLEEVDVWNKGRIILFKWVADLFCVWQALTPQD